MSLKDTAGRQAVLKALYDAIGEELKACRAETQAGLDEADRVNGQRSVAVEIGGEQVATVSLKPGSAEVVVKDADAVLTWVLDQFPAEVERRFVTSVRPAFVKKLLAELTAAGGTEWPDPETGVIHEVPGVEVAPARGRTHQVRFAGGGRERIARAWAAGELAHLVLPELTAGGEQ